MILQLKKKTSPFSETWYYVNITEGENFKCMLATTVEADALAEYDRLEKMITPDMPIERIEILKSKEL